MGRKMGRMRKLVFYGLLAGCLLCLAGCGTSRGETEQTAESRTTEESRTMEESSAAETEPETVQVPDSEETAAAPVQTGLIPEQVLEGEEGEIHFSYYLPDGYSEEREYPLMMTMPGYDMMWFGEDSSGSNLDWRGFLCWTELPEDMIVVSAQLTDWHETSARQAVWLTEYFISNFSVDTDRVYAAGYSAGGETMSQAVSMRPDLYAAYLHGASQWDGIYAPVAENGVAVYIYMAENDEYYGSGRAREAYSGLHEAYEAAGWTEEEIDRVLQAQIPDDAYFAERGINGNYHDGANIVFEDGDVLNWILSQSK